jgi:hypothetical protein
MAEGLLFATLATLVGKKNAARYGHRRVTIGAVGRDAGGRWVMGTFGDGGVVLGEPDDFSVPARSSTRTFASKAKTNRQ